MATLRSRIRRLSVHLEGKQLSLPSVSSSISISLFAVVFLILLFFLAITVSTLTTNYPDVITVLIVIVVISVLILSLVLKPIISIVQEMKQVSELDFSVLDKKYQYSPIKEVRNVQQIFISLVTTMKMYKSFVPASLFEMEDDDDGASDAEESFNEIAFHSSHNVSSDSASVTTPSVSTRSPGGKKKTRSKGWLQKKLQASGKRMAVVLVVNINNYNNLISKMTSKDLVTVHQKYVNAVVNCVREQHGVVDGFIADKIEATWGGMKRYVEDSNPSQAACRAALSIQATIQNLNSDLERQGFPTISVRIGIDKGLVVLSVFGPLSMKQKNCQGVPFTVAHRLENLNKKIGSSILVSERIEEDIVDRDSFRLRPVDAIHAPSYSEESNPQLMVYELQDARSVLKETWMHAFEEKEIFKFYKMYESAFQCFQRSNYKGCIEKLEALQKKMNFEDPVCSSLLKRAQMIQVLKENIPSIDVSDLAASRLVE